MSSGHNATGLGVPDVELMLRVGKDDGDAFAVLYRRHYRKLQDFFYGMSGNAQMAEDLCQETFTRIWRLRARYSPTGSFPGYLFAIARYVWFERRPEVYRGALARPWGESEGAEHEDPGLLPDERAVLTEIGGAIAQAVAALPEDQRMAFVLRTVQGLSLDEIAAAMGCPLNTVRSRKLLAVKKLRETLRGLWVS